MIIISYNCYCFKIVRTDVSKYRYKQSIERISMSIRGPVRYESDDWFQALKSLPSSRILKKTKYYLMTITLWSTGLILMYKKLPFFKKLNIPAIPHSLALTVLGLLLVFRTNASHDRFSDGRKTWSNVVMACRDIATASYIHIDKVHHKKLASLLMMFVICLKQHLQGEFVASEIEPWSSMASDSQYASKNLRKYKNIPIFLLKEISLMITGLIIQKYQKVEIIEKLFGSSLHTLSASIASCERLVKQPVPLSYTRHTSRFLSVYMFTLPLALLQHFGWSTLPVMILLSWSFVSVHEIGLFIENPFSKDKQIIPLNQLISALRSDIDEILDFIIGVDNLSIVKFDANMLQSMKEDSRMKDDNYFAYYQHDSD